MTICFVVDEEFDKLDKDQSGDLDAAELEAFKTMTKVGTHQV